MDLSLTEKNGLPTQLYILFLREPVLSKFIRELQIKQYNLDLLLFFSDLKLLKFDPLFVSSGLATIVNSK